jgi:UDP-N-acetylmuramoyl-tripeptide--D-alanyl-D-alanine ligase
VPDVEAAVDLLRAELRRGDVVLVKASRAAGLERVALGIADDTVPDPGVGRNGNGGGER